ncbi:MAG: hypothetical protein E7628_05710 [Ruminococcaceae bacterium]|nr:hypothetical protein [Oscillospiraceae bacterium]
MKRIISLILVSVFLILGVASCKKSPKSTDPFEINYNYDLSEYITLGNYKGLPATATEYSTDEAEFISLQVKSTLQYYASYAESTVGAKTGDTVFINAVGSIDGKAFAGATATNYELVIGSGAVGALFENKLIGAKKGDHLEFDISVPDSDNEDPDLRGKTVHYEVQINIVMTKVLPEYNDEFVKSNTDYNSVQEYEASIIEQLHKTYEENVYKAIIPDLWESVVESTTVIKYPEDKVKEKYDTFLKNAKDFAELRGLTLAQFAQYAYEMTEDELYEYAHEEAEKIVKEEMICYAIARAEGITLSSEEYTERATEAAELSGFKSLAEFEAAYDIVMIKEALILDMVKEKIADYAEITYTAEGKEEVIYNEVNGAEDGAEHDHKH